MEKVYYPNGTLYCLITPSHAEYFYEDGKVKTVELYLDGELDGEARLYWPNGVLKRRVEFVKGRRLGWDRMWSEKGVLLDEEFYDPR